MSTKLGHLLVTEGLLSEQDRKTIHDASGSTAAGFAKGILALGLLGEEELAAFIADRTHFRVAAKDIFSEIDDRALGAIDTPLLRQLEVLPLRLDSNVLAVAMIDPLDRATVHQIEFFTGCKVKPLIATLKQVRSGLSRLIPGYKPTPSPFELFMATHMGTLRSGQDKKSHAKELVARLQTKPAPAIPAEHADHEIDPMPGSQTDNSDFLESPVNRGTEETENTETQQPAPDPSLDLAAAAGIETPGEPAVNLEPAANPLDSLNSDAAGNGASVPAAATTLAPKFAMPPAVAGNEVIANKALLDLNKRVMDISVQNDPTTSLKVLVDGLFKAGIESGCVAIRNHNEDETVSSDASQGALWSGIDSVANVASGDLRGDLTEQLINAIATYAPEAMESDGWIQILADDSPAVKAALDLIEPGEARTMIETALTTSESVLLMRAFKMQTKPSDLVAIFVWPNTSAGHEALRASVSNALRAYAQKVDKS